MTYQEGHPVVIAEMSALEGTEKGGFIGDAKTLKHQELNRNALNPL